MAVVVTKEIKKKRMLFGVFAALVLASVAIIYFGIFGKVRPEALPLAVSDITAPGEGSAAAGADPVADLKIKILEDERFKELQSSPGVPLKTGTTGKRNPFSE